MAALRKAAVAPPNTDAHHMLASAPHGGHQVEARGARVAGLQAVGALVAEQHGVVVAEGIAVVGEGAGGKQRVVLREIVLQPAAPA